MREFRIYYSDYGSVFIDDTSAHNIEGRVIEVLDSTTQIASLTEVGVSNPLTEHNISGKTLPAGTKIYSKTKFTVITLTAGKVVVY
mgnify:CR=1 FL=1